MKPVGSMSNLLGRRIILQHASVAYLHLTGLNLLAIYRAGRQQHLKSARDVARFVCIVQKVGKDHLAPDA
jgi:hypothetical protein